MAVDVPTAAPISPLLSVPALAGLFATYCYLAAYVGLWIIPFGLVVLLWPFLTTVQGNITLLAFSIFLQNIVISIVSSTIDADGVFTALQGTNYLLSLVIGAQSAIHLLRNSVTCFSIPWGTLCAWGAACSIYAVYGYHQGAGGSALANFRNFTIGLILALVGLAVGGRLSLQQTYRIFAVILLVSLALGLLEWFDAASWYDQIGYANYLQLKNADTPAASSADILDMYTRDLFNTRLMADLGLQALRLAGPMLHPISFGYAATMVCVLGLAVGSWWPCVVSLPFLVQIGSKGPLLLLCVIVGLLGLNALKLSRTFITVAFSLLLAAYVASALYLGIRNDDYHVIGLIGGINGFLRNPIGHGLGVGGNFSNALVTVNWSDFQRNGADFGLESAVGVLLYQMGIAGLGLFALYAMLIKRAYSLALPPRQEATILAALVFVFANAIFQEEAFAPAAIGLSSLFFGIAVANNRKEVPSSSNNA